MSRVEIGSVCRRVALLAFLLSPLLVEAARGQATTSAPSSSNSLVYGGTQLFGPPSLLPNNLVASGDRRYQTIPVYTSPYLTDSIEPVDIGLHPFDEDQTSSLPPSARDYLDYIAQFLGVPITLIGVGPARDQVIWCGDAKQQLATAA